jgi:L-histidine Nalpha-methyltransferase
MAKAAPVDNLHQRLSFEQHYVDRGKEAFLQDVVEGLSATPKWLPYHHFYDARGSELFERITDLEEYYPTNCERDILRFFGEEIVAKAGYPREIVEFGSGSAEKTRILLRAALEAGPVCFVPIDISTSAVLQAGQSLVEEFEGLRVRALAAEYRQGLDALETGGPSRLFLFMGSSIGNLFDEESAEFLKEIRSVARPSDRLLLGADLAKAEDVVFRAYNDSEGVTAEFNKNLLRRINRELGGTFDLKAFRHEAPYLPGEGHVEMRLYSTRAQDVCVEAASQNFHFAEGEYVWTERSRKYTEGRLDGIVEQGGWATEASWFDRRRWFTVRLLRGV